MCGRSLPCPKLYLLCCLQNHIVGQSIQGAELVFRPIKTPSREYWIALVYGQLRKLGKLLAHSELVSVWFQALLLICLRKGEMAGKGEGKENFGGATNK